MKTFKSGFTLMELLVVIVIISLLAGMLFPVFSRIQDRGREVKCTSNLRQLHTAAMSFVNDPANKGRLPRSASEQVLEYDEETGGYSEWWRKGWVESYPVNTEQNESFWWEDGGSNGTFCIQNGTLFQYLGDAGDESVYVCPTMAMKARDEMTGEKRNVTRSYGMNMSLSHAKYTDIDGLSRKILFADQGFEKVSTSEDGVALQSLKEVNDDTDDSALTDGEEGSRRFNRQIDGSIDYKTQSGDNKAETREYIGELHGRKPGQGTGMANAVFADGHVEKVGYVHTKYVCEGNWEYGQPIP
jgi:prepilin-type N-terminal cleavage/methylation domain-containing protein/prepilin-type processing-associated H-X9-DG protein